MSTTGTQSGYRPVRPPPGKGRRSVILAVIAIVVGVAALVGVALLTSSGSTEVRLGDDEFEVGEAATLAARIEADGAPLLFPDLLVGGSRDIDVNHVGTNAEFGWVAFDARVPASARECTLAWDAVATCSLIRARMKRSHPTAATCRTTRPASPTTVRSSSTSPPGSAGSGLDHDRIVVELDPRDRVVDDHDHGLTVSGRSGADAFERAPRQQQALLAELAEPHDRLGLVATALDAEDHALAELHVAHVVADPQPETFRAGGGRTLPARIA